MFSYVIARLKEASTWRGIVALITSVGVTLSPELQGAIVAAGLAVMGLIGTLFPDTKVTPVV
jgi:hypothetical protein